MDAWGRLFCNGRLIPLYQGATASKLQKQITDLELVATEMWELELEKGRAVDLAEATSRSDGEPFEGFDRNDGLWLFALMCSTCQNPAPVVLSILEPNSGDQ